MELEKVELTGARLPRWSLREHAAARVQPRQPRGALQRVERRRAARLPADRPRPARLERPPRPVRGLPRRPRQPPLRPPRGRGLPRLPAHRGRPLRRRPARRALRALRPDRGRAARGAARGRGARRLPARGRARRAGAARDEDALGRRRRARAARSPASSEIELIEEMRLLVIGGTVFLGRAVVADALARGHAVTIFHRGLHNPELFPDAEHLLGDRTRDLSALLGREWDAVIDTCGFEPEHVGAAARAAGGPRRALRVRLLRLGVSRLAGRARDRGLARLRERRAASTARSRRRASAPPRRRCRAASWPRARA